MVTLVTSIELIRQDQKRKAVEHLETMLLEGLDSGSSTSMTQKDWEDIRQSVRDQLLCETLRGLDLTVSLR